MRSDRFSGTVSPFGRLAPAAALVVAALGVLVLAGWAAGGAALGRVFPRGVVMLPDTGVGALLAGSALWLLREGSGARARAIGQGLAVAAGALGAVSLVGHALGRPTELGALLFPGALRGVPPAFRQMGMNSAAVLALDACAFLLLARETRRGWKRSQLLAALCFLVSILALIGHLYDVRPFYTAGALSGAMSLPTAAAFAVLNLGIFFARPARGAAALVTGPDASGVLARQLLPAAILVPVLLGWVWLETRRRGVLDRETAVSAFVALVVGTLAVLVFRAAAAVREIDRAREASLFRERRARGEAEEANRAKMDFLAVMSHELRTPLNAIAGYTELLEMEIHGPVTPAQRGALERIRRSQRHLLLLINDVLNYAKIEAGRVELRPAEVRVSALVAGVEPLILPQAEARELRFHVHAREEDDAAVWADPEKAGQILLNLLSNAVKFTDPGGEVALECAGGGGRVAIRVRDTGRGIPPERLESIFEPFVQVDRGLTSTHEGTGLGLAISRDLARAMGGDLSAESTPGRGSVFTLTLPLAGDGAPSA